MYTLSSSQRKALRNWLYIGIFMTIVQILLGGITRLTGSGLSITEWKPIMGALPPMNAHEWEKAFEGYQEIGQYKYLNNHFTLSDFKFIFFWEWFHRLWGRLIGIVFLVPFLYFWRKKYFSRNMTTSLIVLFVLGLLQAALGWIMVQSGLNENDLYVNHIRLAIHFVAALLLLAYEVWFVLKIKAAELTFSPSRKYSTALIAFLVLITIQFVYGAFMAGLKAAPAAPTWPDINGIYLPHTLTDQSWSSNTINVHFIHRTIAYTIGLAAILLFFRLRHLATLTGNTSLKATLKYPLIFIGMQITLGILAVWSAPKIQLGHFRQYEIIALLHQVVAICILMSVIPQLYLVSHSKASHT